MVKKSSKLWSGRFTQETDKLVEEFSASISFDKVLYKYDIEGSIAHAQMLAKVRIISDADTQAIIKGLKDIQQEIEAGSFKFDPALEDIHMHIEHRLIEKIGEVGKKLHTARSRNDQIALDIRLYLRDTIQEIERGTTALQNTLLHMAEDYIDCVMPGYTHLQRAQPVLFSHQLLAYFDMLERDRQRYLDGLKRVDIMPLGSGALAGTSLPIDRQYVAELLNFSAVSTNSIDSVSDRDFVIEFVAHSAILMMHLSRFCEELVLWSSAEFNFITIADAFCTGSSLMPHKKNPDIPELIRGKTGRVYGSLMALLTVMKALPLSYNKDLQEDKEPLFDTANTIKKSLKVLNRFLENVRPNREVMAAASQDEFMLATELVDYLVGKNVPFRTAHAAVGKLVNFCLENKKTLRELSLEEYKAFAQEFGSDLFQRLSVEKAIESKKAYGGTAKENILRRVQALRAQKSGREE
ncbi:MAG: argininosuccinate lyase [Nitrospinae bacterium RIFCSPLOWO2_12_FULL_45_22]|nr:MAG: argininosuccinate lyase [Nitrospinae bacterium RIFCSPLOWO2_12_FULL_45_22]